MQVNTTGIRVFVYGSLKKGLGNHSVLESALLLGRCKIQGKFQMLDLRYYPGLVFNPQAEKDSAVLGEVYKITKEQLDVLDMIEGHPDYYCRTKVITPWKGAWCYMLPQDYLGKVHPVEETGGVQVWRPNDQEIAYVQSSGV